MIFVTFICVIRARRLRTHAADYPGCNDHFLHSCSLVQTMKLFMPGHNDPISITSLYAFTCLGMRRTDASPPYAACLPCALLCLLLCFHLPCSRTAEVGGVAERMAGGLEDMLNSTPTSAAPSAAGTMDQAARN